MPYKAKAVSHRSLGNKRFDTCTLIVCFALVYTVAFIGSFFSASHVYSLWYNNNKSIITPPDIVFPIVWTVLYFLLGMSLYLAWMHSKKEDKKKIAWSYGINLGANALWTLFFFKLENPTIAFLDLVVIWCSIWFMIFINWRINKASTWLLVPYLLWVSFAGLLNLMFMT